MTADHPGALSGRRLCRRHRAGAEEYRCRHRRRPEAGPQRPRHGHGRQVKQKDEAGAEKTLETLVANYNEPEDWEQMIDVALTTKGMRDIDYVYLGRLMFLPAAKVTPADAIADRLDRQPLAFYGDAAACPEAWRHRLPDAARQADADKKTMPAADRRRRQAERPVQRQAGRSAVQLWHVSGSRSCGPAAKTKGGVTDPTEAAMVLGQALAARANMTTPSPTFGQVTGGSPATRPRRAPVDRLRQDQEEPPRRGTAAAAAAK